MDPLLIDVPARLETARLVLRCPEPGDGPALNAAVTASVEALRVWMPWAQQAPTQDESEAYCRRQQTRFMLREDLSMLLYEKGSDGPDGPVLGAAGLHRIDWAVRSFEIGYWRRSGLEHLGVTTEAVHALTRMAFDSLGARRVEIRMDAANEGSRKVAERAGFTFEGTLRGNRLTPLGEPRDTRVYARVRGIEEPAAGGASEQAGGGG